MEAYGTDGGFEAWLDAMGYELPADAPDVSALRARGSAYIDGTYEALWTGERTGGVMQELGWPRVGALLTCVTAIPDDAIPPGVVKAAYRAAWIDASDPGILNSSATSGRRVAREKVDVIEVAYHDDKTAVVGAGGVAFIDGEIDGMMRPFICDDSDNAGLFIWSVGSHC